MMTRFALSRRQHNSRRQQKPSHLLKRRSVCGLLLLCGVCLTLLLSACTSPFYTPAQSGASTPQPYGDPTQGASTPTPSATPRTITEHISSSCSASIAAIKWDSLLATKPGVNKVQLVTCGSLEGHGSQEAVVGVGYYSPDAKLDIYVYDNLAGMPAQTFKALGLVDGDAQISPAGTLVTAEIGMKGIASSRTNLFKEYQWNNSTFVQIISPFLYPDMTTYQAEQDNSLVTAEIASGQKNDLWKTSGTGEAGHLATSIFHWSNSTQTVLKYDKTLDTITVQVSNTGPGGGGFIATLHHLDGNANNILEVFTVAPLDTNTNITSPASGALLSSPANVSGIAQGGSSILGEIVFYDDTYIRVGESGPIASNGSSGYVNFTNRVSFSLNASGLQEGIVVLNETTQNNLAQINQPMIVKVAFSA
jgi:hypothetical protein